MAVPEFYHFIKPALAFHKDDAPHSLQDVKAVLVQELHLSDDDCAELTPSGSATTFANRVMWALTYLRQAGLLKSVARGVTQITADGLKYLPSSPAVIKTNDLRQFPAFLAFANGNKASRAGEASVLPPDGLSALSLPEQATPEELIAETYGTLRESLAQEVLERVKSMPPAFFERLIVQLMLRLGYGGGAAEAGQALGKSGDGGVDGVINEDKLGLDKIYLQAKRYGNGTVGRPEVQAFVGALSGQGASKGVFITTSSFAAPAKEYARQNLGVKVSLIDGIELARLMIDYDLGVSLVQRYDVKRIDSDFFSEQ